MTKHIEDELPKLAVNISRHKAGGKSTIPKQCSGTSKSNATSRSTHQNTRKSSNRLQNLNLGPDKEFQNVDVGPPKSRRRVLKRASNNPLLRPLHSQRGNRLSRSSSVSSNIACEVSPIGLPIRNKAERHVTTSNDEFTDETITSAADTTGLSGFIVDDDSYIESECSEGGPRAQLRTTTRKLVRGRRHPSSDANRPEQSDTVEDSQSLRGITVEPLEEWIETDGRQTCTGSGRSKIRHQEKTQEKLKKQSSKYNINSKLWEDDSSPEPYERALPQSPSQFQDIYPIKPVQDNSFKTPPQSPSKSKSRLVSPKKLPRIPLTPHQTNTDAFWTRDVIDEWNDQFSPKKVPNLVCGGTDNAGNSWAGKSMKMEPESTLNRAVARTRKDFNRRKHDIAEAFLQDLDRVITDYKVSKLAASTGGIRIIWSKTLKTTAGRANWKRETVKTTSNGKSMAEVTYRHHASIEISEKVIDDEDRLLNVIAHEFCHLANFMVSGVRNNPHGREFKVWASKCSQRFGDRGINVTTKHTYAIEYRYIWTCTNCGTEFKRHSKSIDPQRHQCGSCRSKLVQTKPVPRAAATANEYQLFVKENMGRIKADNPGSPQKDIMSLVGKLYQKHKVSKRGDGPIRGDAADSKEGDISGSGKGACGDDAVDLVATRLNFLDLASP